MDMMKDLTTKIDSKFQSIQKEINEIRDGCHHCGGNHSSSECDDKPMENPEAEAKYAYGGYSGNYYGRNSRDWQDRLLRDE